MSDRGISGAPEMGGDFSHSNAYEAPLEVDAQHWEPVEEPEVEHPSEKHLEMHLTPGGTLEQEVHTEIDQAARKRILESERETATQHSLPDEQELDFAGDFDGARRNEQGWDPESAREYDQWSDQRDNAPFETGQRFERGWDRERGDFDQER